MLSANGRCCPFDTKADSYVRSEGGAVLLLKPLEHAQKDGDRIHAIILASSVNADGARKSGLTAPSTSAQAKLMQHVLRQNGMILQRQDRSWLAAGVNSFGFGGVNTHLILRGPDAPPISGINNRAIVEMFASHIEREI